MSKMKLVLPLAVLLVGCSSQPTQLTGARDVAAEKEFSAMFSPWEGKEAFDKMYKIISAAKEDVKVSVYSWSDKEFDAALEAAAKNGATVRVVLHPDLAKKETMLSRYTALEQLKAKGKISFKQAPRNMHEKFVIVDNESLVNSSANMSNGAKTSYSENFVFLTAPAHIIENFQNEFAVMWNSSKDILTSDKDVVEDALEYDAAKHQTKNKDVILYSSSMNYDYLENKVGGKDHASGKYIKLRAKGKPPGPYTVRDAIIEAIDNAQETILGSFNHFNFKEAAEALIRASKRGVDVKLTVDNQEYFENYFPGIIEYTPYFVDAWKKLPGNAGKEPPVRVKFYSHYPNPSRWLLNHHKWLLVDQAKGEKALLLTGSYNFSETAEHNQFDNMVSFKGKKYASLHKDFSKEFDTLWDLERKGDKPNQEILSHFTTVVEGKLPIHHNRAVSMSWGELLTLRNSIRKIAPKFLRGMNMTTSACYGYDVKKAIFVGCPPK